MKHRLIQTGLSALSVTGLSRLMRPMTRGHGAVLMLHHVRPYVPKAFDPHRGLEITPEFLDAVLTHLKAQGYEIIPLDALPELLADPRHGPPFAVLTFDDGYRDNAVHALPVLKRHQAPFTIFATPGFVDRSAPLWWLDLADAVAGEGSRSDAERVATFKAVHASLRQQPWPSMIETINNMAHTVGINSAARTAALCMDWQELRTIAAEPLCTIGAHSLSHPLLGTLLPEAMTVEMAQSKAILEEKLQRPVSHFAYPVGDALAAGPREFSQAAKLGFATAMTTHPGVLFADHADHLQALPRLSVNGFHQTIASFDALLSGAAFFLLNRGRKVNID